MRCAPLPCQGRAVEGVLSRVHSSFAGRRSRRMSTRGECRGKPIPGHRILQMAVRQVDDGDAADRQPAGIRRLVGIDEERHQRGAGRQAGARRHRRRDPSSRRCSWPRSLSGSIIDGFAGSGLRASPVTVTLPVTCPCGALGRHP